uniref:hypothetical protein n=1 Tax=Hylemonella sp. TaxID=2066020 RepID=UPI0035B3232E
MNLSSTIQVLKIEEKEVTSRKSGNTFKFKTAHCLLLDDGGAVSSVGTLRVPAALEEKVQTGTFRASFALGVPDWGDQKGEITAQLVDLLPAQVRTLAAASAAKP